MAEKKRRLTNYEKRAAIKGKKLSKLTRKEAEFCGLVKRYPALKRWEQTVLDPSVIIDAFGIDDDRTDDNRRRRILGLTFDA